MRRWQKISATNLLSSIQGYNHDDLISLIKATLFPNMPVLLNIDLSNNVEIVDKLNGPELTQVMDQFGSAIEPAMNIFDTLGPLIDIAQLILGGISTIFIETLSQVYNEFQNIVQELFIKPAIEEMAQTILSSIDQNSEQLISALLMITGEENTDIEEEEFHGTSSLSEFLRLSKLSYNINGSITLDLFQGFVNIIDHALSLLIEDPTWLKYVILPMLIPIYEISDLFNIQSILNSIKEPSISPATQNTNHGITLNQEESENSSNDTPIYLDLIFDYFLTFVDWLIKAWEVRDDDESQYKVQEFTSDRTDKALHAGLSDLQGEGGQILLSAIKYGVSLFRFLSVEGYSEENSDQFIKTNSYWRLISSSTSLINSFIEMTQTVILYQTTPYEYTRSNENNDREIISVLEEIDNRGIFDDTSNLEQDDIVDKIMVKGSYFGGIVALIFAKPILWTNMFKLKINGQTIKAVEPVSTFLMNWHIQVRLMEYVISSGLNGNTDVFNFEEGSVSYQTLDEIFGYEVIDYGLETLNLSQRDIILSHIILSLFVNIVTNPAIVIYSLVDMVKTIGNNGASSFISIIESIELVIDIFWRIGVGLQPFLLYYFYKGIKETNYDNYDGSTNYPIPRSLFDDSPYIKAFHKIYEFVFTGLGIVATGFGNVLALVKRIGRPLAMLFALFLDPHPNYKESYFGIGAFSLVDNPDKELNIYNIKDADSIDQHGGLDALELWLPNFVQFKTTSLLLWKLLAGLF